MLLYCDVLSATQERLGDGPVLLTSASFTRMLDGAGSFSIGIPASDPRALSLIQNERRVVVYVEQDDVIREVGRGIIRDVKLSFGASALARTVSGIDALDELKRRNTWIARKFKEKTLNEVTNALIQLVPNWSVSVESEIRTVLMDARFDGASILKAFQEIAKNRGVHFRLGTGNVVEWGNFGQLRTDVRASNTEGTLDSDLPDDVLVIERCEIADSTEDIVNRIVPLGGGTDAGALTLKNSTRQPPEYPYHIQEMQVGNRTVYYIEDSTSIRAYGESEKVLKFTDITPLSNAKNDVRRAANALYDAAVEELERSKDIHRTYRLTVRHIRKTIRPGDKINVRYKGVIYQDGKEIMVADFNEDLYVVKVTETVGEGGIGLTLEVSTKDRMKEDPAQSVVKAMETVKLQGLKPVISVAPLIYSYNRTLYEDVPVELPIVITDAVLEIQRVYVTIRSFPADAHTHQIVSNLVAGSSPANWYVGAVNTRPADLSSFGTDQISIGMPNPAADPDDFMHTGIPVYAASVFTPLRVRIKVDGVDRTTELGGPFPAGGVSGDTFDIALDVAKMTEYFTEATGGLQQRHTITLEAKRDFGQVECIIECWALCQTLAPDDASE